MCRTVVPGGAVFLPNDLGPLNGGPLSLQRVRLPSLAWRSANELTPRRYLAPASQCDSSSNRRRQGSHDDASSDDAGDDSTRLAQ